MSILENETTFKTRESPLKAFLARPNDNEKHPGLIVIHEILGLNESTREISRRFAENGYATLAVDLFSAGNTAICIAQTMNAMFSPSTNNLGTRRLISAVDYLSLQPFVEPTKIGAIGFCMGGNFAIALALEDKRLKTIAPFYSRNPNLSQIGGLCPVVGSYPGMDFTAKHGEKLKTALEEAGIENDIKIYPRALHSFMSNELPFTYNEEASEDAWERTLKFFSKHLVA
jgi:carboxymethylenebutenolidase